MFVLLTQSLGKTLYVTGLLGLGLPDLSSDINKALFFPDCQVAANKAGLFAMTLTVAPVNAIPQMQSSDRVFCIG